MTTQTLTPTQFVINGAGLDLTTTLAAPTQTTLQFTNSGREILFVKAGAGAETVTVDIGQTILGQSVTNFSAVTLTSGDTVAFGPFSAVADQSGTTTMQVVLSTTTLITVALLQFPGVV